MTVEEKYMQRCLELAQLGAGHVAPNPMVGCVIVHKDRIIGEGYHQKFGEAHAEVNAINSVEDPSLLPDSTLYVSLEPCSHYGKTPPCSDLIIRNKIKRVVIACMDPFAEVNGAGIKRLMEAGIDVRIGVLEKEALELNRRFITNHEKDRAYIILKWAETADGFVDRIRSGPEEPALKITCEASDVLVHKWRAEESAIMIGKNTAIMDNPSLTTRKYGGKNPTRLLMDRHLQTPKNAKIFDGSARTLVATERTDNGPEANYKFLMLPDLSDIDLLMMAIIKFDVQSIIVEGGPTLQRSFYEQGLWDEIRMFVSPMKIGEGVSSLKVDVAPEEMYQVGDDKLFIFRNA